MLLVISMAWLVGVGVYLGTSDVCVVQKFEMSRPPANGRTGGEMLVTLQSLHTARTCVYNTRCVDGFSDVTPAACARKRGVPDVGQVLVCNNLFGDITPAYDSPSGVRVVFFTLALATFVCACVSFVFLLPRTNSLKKDD